jgi:hypothetical protein
MKFTHCFCVSLGGEKVERREFLFLFCNDCCQDFFPLLSVQLLLIISVVLKKKSPHGQHRTPTTSLFFSTLWDDDDKKEKFSNIIIQFEFTFF